MADTSTGAIAATQFRVMADTGTGAIAATQFRVMAHRSSSGSFRRR
ncbi:MAG: hypothetical protein MUE37_11295 [Bacteroidales bacterium]|nr:hypothetical protein [Bacteroidales bacterium]